jgi:hypothetical protein
MTINMSLAGDSAKMHGGRREFLRAQALQQMVNLDLVVTTEKGHEIRFPWREVTSFTAEAR